MRRFALVAVMLVIIAGPLFAKAHKDVYPMPCSTLWPAVKDTVRNSGNYAIVFIDNTDMIASFAIGAGNSFRMESSVLNANGDGCEMQVQPLTEPPFSDDAGELKKRVDAALARTKSSQDSAPAKTDSGSK